MAIINTNPNPKDVVILQRDNTNTYYGETHISGSQLILHINSQGYLDADTSQSFYALYPPNNDTASYAISASNFISDVPYPVDARIVKQTDADRDAIPLDGRYEGLVVYVIDDQQDYKLVGGTNNSHWVLWPQHSVSSSYADRALTASFALNGSGGGGGGNLLGANGFLPVWLNNGFTSGSLIWVTKNNVSINNPNPVATDTFTVTELSNSQVLWTPTLISPAPRFWFKADSISRVTGSFIEIWPDSSPNKNHATASNAAARPLLVFDVLNSQQCVRFDGISSSLKVLTPSSVTASAVTAFVVARVHNYASSITPSNQGTIFGNSHPGNNRDIVVGEHFNGGTGRFTWDVYTEDTSVNSFAETPVTPFNALTDQWYINTVVVNGASSNTTLYLSGSASGSSTATLSNNLDLRDLYIGYETSSNQPFDGDIAEIVIFTSSLSTQNQQYVEGYLAWKFGLQGNLPPSHPYKSTYPIPSGSVGNIQIWQDFNGNTVAAMSSSGILYVTASQAISASWAPPVSSGVAVSSSWASASLSSSVSISSSFANTASSAVNAFQAVSASWAPPIASDFAISASWSSQSFWATSASFASNSIWAISASFASQSAFAFTASFASSSASSSVSVSSSFAATASFATNLNPNAISASWASQSLSASFAVTASFATNSNPNAISASWASQSFTSTTASFAQFAKAALSASWASMSISASWAPPIASNFAISASWASQSFWATSASFASNSISASWSPPQNNSTALSASWASMSISASYATQASTSFWAISASWAPSVGTIGTDFYVPKWLGNSLTQTSLIYDSGVGVGIHATSSQINGAFTVRAFDSGSSILWTPQFLSVPSRIWLRGDDVTGAQSSSVSLWPDTGSYNNYFTQSTGANQPSLYTSSLNGHSVIHFDGSNDRMQSVSGSTSITQSSLSVFAVAKPNSYPVAAAAFSNANIIANGHSGNTNDFVFGVRTLSGVREWSMYNESSTNNFDINALASTSQSWYIANGAVNANNSILTVYISNAATSSGVVNGSNLIDLKDLFVGFEPSFGVPFNGEIAEILVTSRTLTQPEQQKVEGYLAWKYGLQNNLPTNHPYFSVAPYALDAQVIQSWEDITSTPVSYVSSSGLFVGTASWANNTISASWAPPSGVTAFALSSSWASQSLSASRADTASFVLFNNGNPNFIVKWADSSSISSSTLYDDGVRVGLNTISPTGRFTINFNNTTVGNNGTDAHLVLSNVNSAAQSQIVFLSGSNQFAGKIRCDFLGNLVNIANTTQTAGGHYFIVGGDVGTGLTKQKVTFGGVRIGQNIVNDAATALLHLAGGDGTSTRGQLKFDSSTLLSSPEAGVVEFNTDKWFCTINTGTARKEFAICDIPLASGSLVGVTTNGRLINATGSGIVWQVSGSYAINSLSSSVTGTLVNTPFYVPFVQNTGSQPFYVSNNATFQYNPAIDTLTLSNITASLFGTASWAVSASNATRAITSSFSITSSFVDFAKTTVSSSFASQSISASWAPVPISASWASQSIWTISSSFASQSISSSWTFQAISASWAPPVASDFAISASFASQSMFSTTASYASASTTSSYVPLGRSVVLCSAYTPTITGADPAEVTIPYSPLDGTTIQNWNVKRLSFRVQTVETNTSSINIEKSVTSGIFSASFVGTVTILSGSYENGLTGSFGTVNSGDKIRFNVTTLGTSLNWTIITELSNS